MNNEIECGESFSMFSYVKSRITKKSVLEMLFCLAASTVILFFCSRSSFFYSFNNWDDANSYFSMGKGIFRGEVPYRDLFDQKGIMLYMLYGLAYLFSRETFHGVFFIGIILFAFTLLGFIRICQLFSNRSMVYFMAPIFGAFVASSRAFYWGGSAEEVMLPFLMWGLYISMSYFRNVYPAPMPLRTVFIGGILAGCIFNIKFNSLGFYFGWIIMVLLAILLGNGSHKISRFIGAGLIFLGGMLVATIPWIIYFMVNHSVYEWLHVYLYLNIFVYSKSVPFALRIFNMVKTIYNQMWNNILFGIWIIWGFEYFFIMALKGKKALLEFCNLFCMLFFQLLLIFIGGVDLPYYPLPVSIFACLGFISLIAGLGKLIHPLKHRRMLITFGFVEAFVLTMLIIFAFSTNISYHKYTKEDLVVYKYADIINKSGVENPTILDMNCLDAGLYTVTGAVPNCYFFQTQTIHLDEVNEMQSRDIHHGNIDFIIARDEYPYGTEDHYKLISKDEQTLNGDTHVYYLYEKVR